MIVEEVKGALRRPVSDTGSALKIRSATSAVKEFKKDRDRYQKERKKILPLLALGLEFI